MLVELGVVEQRHKAVLEVLRTSLSPRCPSPSRHPPTLTLAGERHSMTPCVRAEEEGLSDPTECKTKEKPGISGNPAGGRSRVLPRVCWVIALVVADRG